MDACERIAARLPEFFTPAFHAGGTLLSRFFLGIVASHAAENDLADIWHTSVIEEGIKTIYEILATEHRPRPERGISIGQSKKNGDTARTGVDRQDSTGKLYLDRHINSSGRVLKDSAR
jgi:hypothetical protein